MSSVIFAIKGQLDTFLSLEDCAETLIVMMISLAGWRSHLDLKVDGLWCIGLRGLCSSRSTCQWSYSQGGAANSLSPCSGEAAQIIWSARGGSVWPFFFSWLSINTRWSLNVYRTQELGPIIIWKKKSWMGCLVLSSLFLFIIPIASLDRCKDQWRSLASRWIQKATLITSSNELRGVL